MATIDRNNPMLKRLENEHDVFRASVREIKAELDRGRDSRDFLSEGDALLVLLQDFRELLKRHFSFEEKGWNEVDPAECTPSTQRWVAMLTRQHEHFLETIDRLVSSLESALLRGKRLPPGFEGELSGLLHELTQHEFSESRLFQRAVFEELGGFE
jgi:hypothetical protein